ncbi:MAG: DUF4062 domain-containing protein [Burkholderiales bacterium]
MSGQAGVIRTPDQRVRVFVSSTLRELAPERRVARAVIERLALAPVMFELGARPHPPRSLYRAYLEQSDIFVGVYWESYGWVAPDEEVSGLEDEYNLAPDVPMLIYVKRSEQRQQQLQLLLDRIRDDDRASYVAFDDAEDLEALLTSDLATLMAERFDEGSRRRTASLNTSPDPASSEFLRPPTPLTRLVGRETDLHRVVELLVTDAHRLVSLTGPGGIGKTRLAIAAAAAVEESFPDGVVFVDLAPIREPSLVISTIATALGIRGTGIVPLSAMLAQALNNRRILLLLDNVEQVVAAAADLSALLSSSPVSMLATSRIVLRIDGEQNVALAPLPSSSAIELFVERARAVKPEFELTDDNAAYIAAITTALDNIPLALELAAARLRVLTPAELSERLDRALPVLVGGARDRPERQRTLRATIEWSTGLLSDMEREFLLRTAVFRSGFGLDAAEWMRAGQDGLNTIDLLGALVEGSLVQEQDRGSRSWFTLLATVREYAREELERRGDLEQCEQLHAEFYSDLAVRAEPHLLGAGQHTWLARLRDEYEDIRAAAYHYLGTAQGDAVAQLLWPLYWFWWVTGRLTEVADLISRIEDADHQVSEQSRMRAKFLATALAIWKRPDSNPITDFEDCLSYFIRTHDLLGEYLSRVTVAMLQFMHPGSESDAADHNLQRAQSIAEDLHSPSLTAMALLFQGQASYARGNVPEATRAFDASLDAARVSGEVVSQAAALYHLGWVHVLPGNHSTARDYFVQALLISSSVGHEEGVAYSLEGLFAVSVSAGELDRAGKYLGAAENIRERKGLLGHGMFSYHQQIVTELETSPTTDSFHRARAEGQRAEIAEVVEEALS